MDDKDVRDALKALPRLRMGREDYDKIWEHVQVELADCRLKRKTVRFDRRRTGRRLMPVAAVAAGFLVIVGGSIQLRSALHHPAVSKPASISTSNGRFDPPFAITAGEWRVVVTRSYIKQGPYYTYNVYYIGKSPAHAVEFSSGGTSIPAGPSIVTTGSAVSGVIDAYLPNGFQQLKTTVTWIQGGQKHSQVIDFDRDPIQLLAIASGEALVGGAKDWTAKYGNEAVGDGSLQFHSEGEFSLHYSGPTLPADTQAEFVVHSDAGTFSGQFPIGGNNARDINVSFDDQPEYQINSGVATVTVRWPGHTQSFQITRPQPRTGIPPEVSMVAADDRFFAQKIGAAYGDSNPRLAKVDGRSTRVTGQINLYYITLAGHFHDGTRSAVKLQYHISADGSRVWDIEGLNTKNQVVWRDDKVLPEH